MIALAYYRHVYGITIIDYKSHMLLLVNHRVHIVRTPNIVIVYYRHTNGIINGYYRHECGITIVDYESHINSLLLIIDCLLYFYCFLQTCRWYYHSVLQTCMYSGTPLMRPPFAPEKWPFKRGGLS